MHCSSGDKNIKISQMKTTALLTRLVEVVAESIPQSSLQLYIAAQSNKFDALLSVSIASSLFSATCGIIQGVWSIFTWMSQNIKRESGFLFCIFYFPLIFSVFTSFVVPVSFFAALKGHTHPAYAILLLYFPLHMLLFLAIPFCQRHSSRQKAFTKFVSFVPSLLYAFVSLWISTCWIVSLAPFLDENSRSILPSFIWPNAALPFHQWVVENTSSFSASWTTCNMSQAVPLELNLLMPLDANSSKINHTTPASQTPSKLHPFTSANSSKATNIFTFLYHRLTNFQFCLTQIAAPLYYIIIFFVVIPFIHGCFNSSEFFEKHFYHPPRSEIENENRSEECEEDQKSPCFNFQLPREM